MEVNRTDRRLFLKCLETTCLSESHSTTLLPKSPTDSRPPPSPLCSHRSWRRRRTSARRSGRSLSRTGGSATGYGVSARSSSAKGRGTGTKSTGTKSTGTEWTGWTESTEWTGIEREPTGTGKESTGTEREPTGSEIVVPKRRTGRWSGVETAAGPGRRRARSLKIR